MLPGRAAGASLAGELLHDHFEYTAAVFHGAGDVGPFRDGRGLSAASRLLWAPQGRSIEGEVDFEDMATTAVLGVSALAGGWLRASGLEETSGVESPRPPPVSTPGNTPGRRSLLGFEALLRSHFWDFGGEVFGGVEELDRRTSRVGAYLRTERFFPGSCTSLGARVSRLVERVVGAKEPDGETVAEVDGALYLRRQELKVVADVGVLRDDTSPLFLAAMEATEEAIINSLFMAQTTKGHQGHAIERLPVSKTLEILKKYGKAK